MWVAGYIVWIVEENKHSNRENKQKWRLTCLLNGSKRKHILYDWGLVNIFYG